VAPTEQKAGWVLELIWMLWEWGKISCLCWESNHSSAVIQSAAYSCLHGMYRDSFTLTVQRMGNLRRVKTYEGTRETGFSLLNFLAHN